MHVMKKGCVSGVTDLSNHVPVESVEHGLAMLVLAAERGPELGAHGAVDRPRVLSDEELELALAALLDQRLDLLEGLEGRFLACE